MARITWEFVPARSSEDIPFTTESISPEAWRSTSYVDEFKGIHVEPVQITRPNDGWLDVYWQDGPQFSGWGAVVAKFPDGTPAIVEGQSGKGFVIFTGVHLEAPQSWRGSMIFRTPVAVDLAYAGTVFPAALNGTALPHF